MFEKELEFFQKNQDRLVEKHAGMVLVIKENEVVGAYPTALAAFIEASKVYEAGTFMIQPCQAGIDAYTVTISTLGMIITG